MARQSIVPESIRTILSRGKVDGTTYFLPPGQLPRDTYQECNKVLTALGGKWNRKLGGHAFPEPAGELIDAMIETGLYSKPAGDDFYPTPKHVVEQMLAMAELSPGNIVLEPSAGNGAIATAIRDAGCVVHLWEIMPRNRDYLEAQGFTIDGFDFMECDQPYFRIIMNPPFSKNQTPKHILHAYEILVPGGIIVSVAPSSVMFREDKQYVAVRDLAEEIVPLPEGTFKQAGTMVNTVLVKIRK